MTSNSSSQFKKNQDRYFGVEQPHLKASIDNYTLKLAKRLAEQASLKPQDSILEIGCGSGRFTLPLLKLHPKLKIYGLDFSAKLIKELNRLKLPNVKTILGDIDQVDKLTNANFNKIIGFYILHHLPNLQTSLLSLSKVARKNTAVAFVEPNPWNLMYYPQPFISKNMSWQEEKGFRQLTPNFLKKNFEAAGFRDVAISRFGFFPPFITNTIWGEFLDNQLEKIPVKTFLPFQLITAKLK